MCVCVCVCVCVCMCVYGRRVAALLSASVDRLEPIQVLSPSLSLFLSLGVCTYVSVHASSCASIMNECMYEQVVEYEEGGLYALHTDAFPLTGTLPEDRQPMLGGQVFAFDLCVCVCARVGMRVFLCLPCTECVGQIEIVQGAQPWESANVLRGMGLRSRTERRQRQQQAAASR